MFVYIVLLATINSVCICNNKCFNFFTCKHSLNALFTNLSSNVYLQFTFVKFLLFTTVYVHPTIVRKQRHVHLYHKRQFLIPNLTVKIEFRVDCRILFLALVVGTVGVVGSREHAVLFIQFHTILRNPPSRNH
jgi:hypothetical protein